MIAFPNANQCSVFDTNCSCTQTWTTSPSLTVSLWDIRLEREAAKRYARVRHETVPYVRVQPPPFRYFRPDARRIFAPRVKPPHRRLGKRS